MAALFTQRGTLCSYLAGLLPSELAGTYCAYWADDPPHFICGTHTALGFQPLFSLPLPWHALGDARPAVLAVAHSGEPETEESGGSNNKALKRRGRRS